MWRVEYTKRFLKELAKLPRPVQEQVEIIVFDELECLNPFDLGYLEKMQGYADKYKFRVGDYRVGLTIEKKSQVLICERVVHRQKIYKVFP